MATVTSETPLEVITEAPKYNPTSRTVLNHEHEEIKGEEVITEAPKYNPTSRTVLDPQNEHEEIEGKEEEQKKRRNEDECCNRCCYDSTDPCDNWLIICCFCSDDCDGCCDDCGDCCDDCDGCDCSD